MSVEGETIEVRFDADFVEILNQEYPHFTRAELDRRRRAVEQLMIERSVDHVLIYGIGARGSAIRWLSEWLVTNEALLVVSPAQRDALFVQYYNHVPLARHIARDAHVHWGGASTAQAGTDELLQRGARRGRVGVIGPLSFGGARVIENALGTLVDLNADYNRLRLVKSPEELVWFGLGARLADLSIAALESQLRPGLSERDLCTIVEHAYHPYGGVNGIHYFAVNAMDDPQYCVARQHPSTRVVARGDVVSTEITANFYDYGAQILRTFSVGDDLNTLFQELHDVAEMAYREIAKLLVPGTHVAQLVQAAHVIEDAGFTTYDDLVHGYGGGYLAPVLGSTSRTNEPIVDMVLEEGMMVVVQPNVVTLDHRAGVQTGECLVVTPRGPQRLHVTPPGARRVG